MEALRNIMKKELLNLDVEESDEINIKMVEKKFKKKALKVHPDKTGTDDDAEFKELLADFKKVQTALNELEIDDEEDKGDVFTFFEKNNVVNEKSQSWTILVEKDKVEEWSNVLRRKFGESKLVGSGSGHQFKAPVGVHNVSITLYKYPGDLNPKMNVQGNKVSLRHFVCNVLPELYKKVRDKTTTTVLTNLTDDTTHNCNICDKVYKQKRRLTTHMEMKHTGAITGIKLNVIQQKKDSNQEVFSPAPIPYKYSCTICGEGFKQKTHILVHQKNMHPPQNKCHPGVKAISETIEVVDIVDEIIKEVVQPLKDTTNTPTKEVLQDVEPNVVWLTATNDDLDEMLKTVNYEINQHEVKCEVCNITFRYINEMEDHIGNIHIKVVCDTCSEGLSTLKYLEAHKKEKHTDSDQEPVQEIPTCDMCGIMLYSDQQISEHITRHGDRYRNSNKEISKDYDEGPYICAECGRPFTSKDATEEHMRNEHSDPTMSISTNVVFLKPVDCRDCKIHSKEKDALEKEKEYIETEFEKLYIKHEKLKDLYDHQKEQNKERLNLYKENKELREAATNSQEIAQDLLRQTQILTEDLKTKNGIIEADEKLNEIAIEVENQSQEFQDATGWMSPEVIAHNGAAHKCPMCPWTSTNIKLLKGHMTKHKIKCQKCSKTVSTKQELFDHIVRDHSVVGGKYACSMCDKIFATSESLMQHKTSKHQRASNLKKVNQQQNTENVPTNIYSHPVGHNQWAEGKNRESRCKECAAEFVSKADLNKHIQECLDYSCFQCGYRFHTHNELKQHKARKHEEYPNEGFKQQISVCRYFIQNRCTKGQQCRFDHPTSRNTQPNPLICKRGQGCAFLARGDCHFFHQGYGVQSSRSSVVIKQMRPQYESNQSRQQQTSQVPCHFQERCWNDSCRFFHEDFFKTNSFLENY